MSRPIALVTGAGVRIGADIARRLAKEGYGVALLARASLDAARALAAEIEASGGLARAFAADLSDPRAAEAAFAEASAELGPVELLVNNAGMFDSDTADGLDLERWRRQFAVNLESPVFLAAAFAKALPENREGSIVNIVDQRVLRLTPQHFSYTLTKAALWAATQTLAQAYAPRIRVNAVGPGPTYPSIKDGNSGFAHESAGTLLGRAVRGDEIAEAVLYLARARNVTGQIVCVDAGQHLAWRTPDIVD